MNTDCYFERGKTHLVCEDYALVEARPAVVPDNEWGFAPVRETPFILVSDGCSSSKHTDVGARRLCFAAKDLIAAGDIVQAGKILETVREFPWIHRQDYRGPNYLDATLLAAYPFRKVIEVVASGDGVICARRRKDQVIETHRISFNGNAPGYISYLLDLERGRSYTAGHGIRTVFVHEGRELVDVHVQKVLTEEFVHLDYRVLFPTADYDLVALFSDGVESFQREVSRGRFEPVEMFDVLDQLLAIKNTTGQFVVRRIRRFLGKFCVTNNWHHNDDVSMAAIYIPEEEEP